MWFLRKPPPAPKCHLCGGGIDKKTSFQIHYKAADGMGVVEICEKCGAAMEELRLLYNGDTDA